MPANNDTTAIVRSADPLITRFIERIRIIRVVTPSWQPPSPVRALIADYYELLRGLSDPDKPDSLLRSEVERIRAAAPGLLDTFKTTWDSVVQVILTTSTKINIKGKIGRREVSLFRREAVEGGYGSISLGSYNGGYLAFKRTRTTDGEAERRFLREGSIWSKLDHRCIVAYYGTEKVGNITYHVAPYGIWGNALNFLTEVNPPPGIRLSMIADLADAIAYLHCVGRYANEARSPVLHGDLKPDNIVIGGTAFQPAVWLADFGLSKEEAMATSVGFKFAGNQWYHSPERLVVDSDGTSRSAKDDIFALGICAAEIFLGRRAYDLNYNMQAAALVAVRNLRPQLPVGPLHEVARRCWASLAEDRPTADKAFDWFTAVRLGNRLTLPTFEDRGFSLE